MSNAQAVRRVSCLPDFCCTSSEQFLEENLECESFEHGNRRIGEWIPCLILDTIATRLNKIVITVTVEFHLLQSLVGILEESEYVVDLARFVLAYDAFCDL